MIFLDKFLQGLKPQFDDDGIDRLNYYYTPTMLVIFALTLSAKQYVGQPIQCWVPAQGIQAILFYLPALLWRIMNWQSGVAVKGIVTMCQDVNNMFVDKRKNSVDVVAAHLNDSLRMQKNLEQKGVLSKLLGNGTYLTYLYLFVKVLYLVQVLMQFIILNNFLGTNYTFWGFEILRDLAYGREWAESGHFPRVTMCDFEVRVLGNKHRHTVQCVLMINMFNEKVYLFVWWWLLIVAVATFCSLIFWIVDSFSRKRREEFISQFLRVSGVIKSNGDLNEKAVAKFVNHEMRHDGIFLLRLISANAGDLISTDLIFQLWRLFLEKEAALRSNPPSLTHKLEDVDYPEKKPIADL
uniref:Innexin n=1 Tax=Rhabditophanes sp. KR3021 TaxID=114890 RepID=A0AC35UD03_9BILA